MPLPLVPQFAYNLTLKMFTIHQHRGFKPIASLVTVRRSALHGLCDRNSVRLSVRLSVCPSVCHTRGLCPHDSTYDRDFFTIW